MNIINVILTIIIFALFSIAGLLIRYPEKGDELMVQLAKGQVFSEEGIYKGQIEYLDGQVEKRMREGEGWVAVAQNEPIVPGMELRTLSESRAVLTFVDGSVLRMDEVTQLKYDSKIDQMNIFLKNGQVYNRVAENATRKYRAEVGDYKLTALGTAFNIKKEIGGNPKVLVLEGMVDVTVEDIALGAINENERSILDSDALEVEKIVGEDLQDPFVDWNVKSDTRFGFVEGDVNDEVRKESVVE